MADAAPPTPAAQQGASPLLRVGAVRVPLEVSLKVNDKFLGTISIAVDPRGDGEIDARRLIDLIAPVVDAKVTAALNARIAGRAKVDFTELDVDGFTIRFDSAILEVVGTLAPDASLPTSLHLEQQQDVPVPSSFDQPAGFAAGLNIAASQRYVYGSGMGGWDRVRMNFGAIANIGGFDGVTLTGGATYNGERWERREFRATHDNFDAAIRMTVGEFTPSSTSFQGSGAILGFGMERAYSTIRPFQNIRPTGRQEFTLQRDSSVDVFVNQIRVQTIRLAAGRYDISDFPFAAGPNQVQLVVEDIGGKREIVNFDVFNTTTLLNRGATEFGVAAGIRDRGQLSYGSAPAATGYYYRGISDTMTLGANAQATNRGAQLGAVAVVGTPIGLFQVEASASKGFAERAKGVAASLDYRGDFSIRSKNDLRVSASAIYRSASFQNGFSIRTRNSNVLDSAFQVQWQAPLDISLGLGAGYSKSRERGLDSYRLDGSLGRSFGRLGVSVTAGRVMFRDGRGNDARVAIGLSLRLGRRDNVDARYDSGRRRAEVEVNRLSEGRLGEISGSVRYTQDRDANAVSGRVAYINNRFDLLVNHNRIEQTVGGAAVSNVSDWNVRSFVGFVDGTFGLGRSVDEGFIIAPVHRTLHGAQASLSSGDRVVARSGLFGPALLGIGRAYGVNRFDVKVAPLPIGYDLGSGSISTFPGYGSGYRFQIGSDASHIGVGVLVGDGGPVALASGTIEPVDAARRKTWKERGFFTNRSGRFVADRLAPGRYRLIMAGKPVAEFEIGKQAEGLVDVGTLHVRP